MPIKKDSFDSKHRRMDVTRTIQRFLENHEDRAFTPPEIASEIYNIDEQDLSTNHIDIARAYLEVLTRFSELEVGSTIVMRQNEEDPQPYFAAVQKED